MIRTLATATTTALTATLGLAAPANAAATMNTRCGYPYVCLYRNHDFSHPTGRFRDITASWQHLTRSRGANGIVNTRHTDTVHLKLTNGRTICVAPNTTGGLAPGTGGITDIRIFDRNHC